MIADIVLLVVLAGSPSQEAQDAGNAATALWDSGQRLRAIATLQETLSENPQERGLARRLAEWQLAVHQYEAALTTAATLGDEGRSVKAHAFYALARYEESLAFFNLQDPLQILMRLDACEVLGKEELVLDSLQRAISVLGKDHPRVLIAEGSQKAREGLHDEAASLYEQVLLNDPYNLQALYGFGTALVRSGSREEGLALLSDHRRMLPLVDQLDHAYRSLDIAPHHAPNHALVGDALVKLGRFNEAHTAFSRAIDLATDESLVPITLRAARLASDQRDDVASALGLLGATWEQTSSTRIAVRAGDLLVGENRFREAVDWYQKADLSKPNDPQINDRLRLALEQVSGGN